MHFNNNIDTVLLTSLTTILIAKKNRINFIFTVFLVIVVDP